MSLLLLAVGLREMNVEPVVVTSREGDFTNLLKENGIEYRVVRMGMWRKGKSFPFIPWALYRIYRWVKSENIDIIHANTLWDNPYGVLASRLAGVPLLCHLRSKVRVDMVRKYFLNSADAVISVSKKLAEPVEPLISGRLTVIYNGVDTKRFNPSVSRDTLRLELGVAEEEILVGLISRVDPLKGQKLFLEAARLVHKTHPNVKFLIAGGCGQKQAWYAERIKAAVSSDTFNSFCFYLGHRENIEEVFSAIDISVLPSLEEGLGRTNIEAMALAKPVISTAVGGIPETITDGKNGFLIPYDSLELALRLRTLIASDSLRKNMGLASRERAVNEFSVEKYVAGVFSVYEKLCKVL